MMNFQKMMQQAQVMQQKMQALQEKVAQMEVQGSAGGGLVKVVMTCRGEVRSVEVDPSVINPNEKEVLEDLLKAAMNEARTSGDATLADETRRMMEEIGLPAGTGLPF